MDEWIAHIAAKALNDNEPELDVDVVDDFVMVLEDNFGAASAVSFGAREWSVELALGSLTAAAPATHALSALSEAVQVVNLAAEKAAMPRWPIVRASVALASEVDAELAEPQIPNLVGVSEVAALLGLSRQRASEVGRLSGFPAPVAMLASGPVWAEPAVLRFVESWPRRPGRPSERAAG